MTGGQAVCFVCCYVKPAQVTNPIALFVAERPKNLACLRKGQQLALGFIEAEHLGHQREGRVQAIAFRIRRWEFGQLGFKCAQDRLGRFVEEFGNRLGVSIPDF